MSFKNIYIVLLIEKMWICVLLIFFFFLDSFFDLSSPICAAHRMWRTPLEHGGIRVTPLEKTKSPVPATFSCQKVPWLEAGSHVSPSQAGFGLAWN